jgi:hypothetical protein
MTEEEKNIILDAVNNLDKTPKGKEIGVYAFVRHGKWIEINTESGIFMTYDEVKCSECGFVEYFNKGWARFKYCPTCGAKMDVEE